MTRVPTHFVLVVLLAASVKAFGGGSKQTAPRMGFMDRRAAENELLLALGEALGKGHGFESESLHELARHLAPTFASLPQNRHGRIGISALRYLINSYFMRKRGWRVKGLEPHRNVSGSDLSDMMPVLKQKVPLYTKSVFEGQETSGFLLKDAVVLVALLEHLVLDEGTGMLRQAYDLNDVSIDAYLSADSLDDVLDSIMVLWVFGSQRDYRNKTLHLRDRAGLRRWTEWQKQMVLTRDVLRNSVFSRVQGMNPFVAQSFSFEDAAALMPLVNRAFGELHEVGCNALRDGLIERDPAATGRVPLGQFYAAGTLGNAALKESVEYLRNLGVLDDTASGRGAQVIISNYVTSISNCDAHSDYYLVCCLAQCESIFNDLEVHFQASTARPAQILVPVEEKRLSMMDEPRNLSTALVSALDKIASLHGGEVPLHSRMFAQWMHYAFPYQCPYPYMSGVVNPLSPKEYKKMNNVTTVMIAEDAKKKAMSAVVGDAVDPMSMWTFEEEMQLGSLDGGRSYRNIATVCAAVMQIAAGSAILLGLWRSMADATRRWLDGSRTKTTEHFV